MPKIININFADDEETDEINSSLDVASRRDPDEHAESLKFAGEQNLPVETVTRQKDEVRRRGLLSQIDILDLEQSSPKTAKYLRDPDNASVSIDDVNVMQDFEMAVSKTSEGAFDKITRAGRAILAGVGPSIGAGSAAIGQVTAETLAEYVGKPLAGLGLTEKPPRPFKDLAEYFKGQRAAYRKISEEFVGDTSQLGQFERDVLGGMQSLGEQSIGTVMSVITRNPAYALLPMTAMAGSRGAVEALDEGIPVWKALLGGVATGATEFAFERLPIIKLLEDFDVGSGLFKTLGKQFAIEIPAEQATTIIQDLVAWSDVGINKGKTFGDYLEERPQAALSTLIATGAQTTLQTTGLYGVSKTAEKIGRRAEGVARKADEAIFTTIKSDQEQAELDNIITYSQSSATRERSPDHWEKFVETVGADREVIIPEEVALEAGIIEELSGLNVDVTIPLKRFAAEIAIDEEVMNIIRPHIKLDANSLSQNELKVAGNAEIEKMIATAKQHEDTLTEAEQVFESVKSQLVATGMQSEVTARYSAQLYPAAATVYVEKAKKLGHDVTVGEMYEMMGFQVRGPEAAAPVEGAGKVILDQPALEDIEIEMDVETIETGENVTEKFNAAQVMEETDSKITAYDKLIECLG